MRLPKDELKIGKYQLLQRLASGGMGEVFLALQEGPAGFLRKVVIKRMRSPITENPTFVEMFLNEARLAALLSHPNVVHILELGKAEDGSWFIAMEHIHGRSLREVLNALIRRGTPGLPPGMAARLCADVLRGLHHAHEMRDAEGRRLEIIHRDISPENILVSFSGTVKLVDFGIAKAVAESTAVTQVSQLRGKVPFLAPEQLRRERVDARTDVYATGCVLYEMLSGQSAFPIRSDADLMEEVLTSMPTPLGTLCPHIPEPLGAIALRAMAKSPGDRFASAQEMASALEDFLLQSQVRVPPEEVSHFLAGLFGAPAADPTPVAGVPRVSSRATPSSDPPKPRPPELPPDLEFTQLAVPLPSMPEPPVPSLPRALPSVVVRHVTPGAPTQVVEAPPPEISEEPVTELAGTQRPPPEPARVELPVGGAPPKPRAWRWLLPLVAAALGVTLMVSGAGFLQPDSEPPAASPEALARADSEPRPELPPAPPAADVEKQAVSEPPPAATARPSPRQEAKARPPRSGLVVLYVKPSAEVFVGSKRLGVTPLDPIELPAGRHTLTLKNAELGVTRRIRVKVPAGGKVTLRETLRRPASRRR